MLMRLRCKLRREKFSKSIKPLAFRACQFCGSTFVAQRDPDGAYFAHNNYADPIYAIYLTPAINTTSYQFINFRGRLPLLRLLYVSLMNQESNAMKNHSRTLSVVDSGLMSLSVHNA